MKSGVPWSIRGIDEETREAARAAAQRSGLSVAEWLNEIIAEHAGDLPGIERDQSEGEEDDQAIVASLERLSRRIRSMDLRSRAAVPELAVRLDEIEQSLEKLPPALGSPNERSRTLRSVAVMIEQLSRELDSADENARRMVEGLRGRAARAGAKPHDEIADAVRDLDARIATLVSRQGTTPKNTGPVGLDDLKRQLESLLAKDSQPAPPSDDHAASLDAALRSLETRIDRAKARLVSRVASLPGTAGDDERMRGIEERLAEATAHLGSKRPLQPKRRLGDDLSSAIAEIAARQKALDERSDALDSVSSLRRDIADLTEKMAAFGRVGGEEKGAFYDLVRRIDALATERPLDRHLLSSMQSDLEALRATIDGDKEKIGIAARLDGLIERTPDRGRLDALGEEVAAMRRALEAADSPRAIARLEMRIAELARSVEAAVNGDARARRQSESDGLARLEASLNEVAARIDGLLDRSPSQDALAAVLDRVAAIAARLDDIDAFQSGPAAALDDIKSELVALRSEIAGRPVSQTDRLERQVADLAKRLDVFTRAGPDAESLAELEAQVLHLSAELERAMPRTAALKHVEENLAQLQKILAENREESIEAARMAARLAVTEFAADQNSGILRSLRDDLERVRGVAGSPTVPTRIVKETLSTVAERLSRLEEGESASSFTAKHAETAVRGEGEQSPASASAPSNVPEDNRPLEPGSGKPDLAALRELAGSASGSSERKTTDRKADFIAAARRAAQAAAAEAAPPRETEAGLEGDDRLGTLARIGRAIRSRRRPLLLAAAAIVLAIGALRIFGDRINDLVESAARGEPLITTAEPVAPKLDGAATPAAAAGPQVSEPALVAPTGGARDLAFAQPEAVDSRFGSGTNAPSPVAFSPQLAQSVIAAGPPSSAEISLTPDPAIGSTRLVEAATAGDPSASLEVAVRYAEGHSVPADLRTAAVWYARAAEGGIAVAQYRLGSLYERGQGVEKDLRAAVTWYQRAADQGNVGAMHNLAVLLSEGVDGEPDHAKAREWFQNAAVYGVKDSQYNLGVIYARGIGVPADMAEAYKWFAIAAAQGDSDAAMRRDDLAKAMSGDDLARARASVSAWHAKPTLPEANAVPTPEGGWDNPASTITAGDQSKLVAKIQELLAEQGYDPGPADGVVGARTREAVRAFQKTIGVAETGEISRDLVAALSGQT